jgi:predicted enzyme related to lactoylglutathione lyase
MLVLPACRASTEDVGDDAGDRREHRRGDGCEEGAGGVGRSQHGVPGYATFYVEVDDPKAYLDKAEELGGKTIVPPAQVPGWDLTFALFADPEGHMVGLARGAAAVKP